MSTPTMYEYAGGADAMHRLADAQYRRCLTDPLLQQVFGTEGKPEHVDHLAAWLGEVFGGPKVYTNELGGHGALLRHNGNLSINEAQRALRRKEWTQAEAVFRTDLARNPANPRSLFGLAEALSGAGKKNEAAKVRADFQKYWAKADVKLSVADL